MTILAVIAIIVGLFWTLAFAIFCMAGLANTKPGEGRSMWILIWTIIAVGLGCAIAATVLTCQSRPGLASLVGAAPIAIDIALFAVAMALEI